MYEIRFLKKHIIILVSVAIFLGLLFLYGQFSFLGKRYDERKQLRVEIADEQVLSATLKKRKTELEKLPELVKSDEIKGFTTSDEIAEELTAIEKKFEESNVNIISLTMEEEDYFRDETLSNEAIKRKVVTMDITADTNVSLESFINEIETNKTRVGKVQSVDYKASPGTSESTSATIVYYTYYVQMED